MINGQRYWVRRPDAIINGVMTRVVTEHIWTGSPRDITFLKRGLIQLNEND